LGGQIENNAFFLCRPGRCFKYDIKRRVPAVSKAKRLLGWEPKVKLKEGLKEVINWLKEQKLQGKIEN